MGRFCIAVPADITEVEKRAFYEVVAKSDIKAREIKIVEKPIADAVGLGIDISSSKGNMIVNIGAVQPKFLLYHMVYSNKQNC